MINNAHWFPRTRAPICHFSDNLDDIGTAVSFNSKPRNHLGSFPVDEPHTLDLCSTLLVILLVDADYVDLNE